MLDKTLAVLAIVVLIGFVSIMVVFVKSPSLIIVVVIGILFAGYDFYRSAFGDKNGG